MDSPKVWNIFFIRFLPIYLFGDVADKSIMQKSKVSNS